VPRRSCRKSWPTCGVASGCHRAGAPPATAPVDGRRGRSRLSGASRPTWSPRTLVLVPMPGHEEEAGTFYVATNAHVVGAGFRCVRLNTAAGGHDSIEIDDADWIRHPDGDDLGRGVIYRVLFAPEGDIQLRFPCKSPFFRSARQSAQARCHAEGRGFYPGNRRFSLISGLPRGTDEHLQLCCLQKVEGSNVSAMERPRQLPFGGPGSDFDDRRSPNNQPIWVRLRRLGPTGT
jgi:hypothetical protein